MSRYGSRRFPPYVSVGEKRARAENKIKQLEKKNPRLRPIIIEGYPLAKTWWGKAWNENLERYADYANRIGRGRSYVRHRAVLDLQIEPGKVTALVQGSRARPYRVGIEIRALGRRTWESIKQACSGQFDSLQVLSGGKFPTSLAEIFTARGQGLFPAPEEINFDCSCPDWAGMCKHVAATLYGIGARLDEDPALFFELRQVTMSDLIGEAMQETADQLLQKANGPSGQAIDDADLEEVFGIVMEDSMDFDPVAPLRAEKAFSESPTPGPGPKTTARSRGRQFRKSKQPGDDKVCILELIGDSRVGIDVPTLSRKTGVAPAKIRNIVFAAYRKGQIEKLARGIYRGPARRRSPGEEVNAVLTCIDQSPAGIGVPQIEHLTGVGVARVRYIVARACRDGKIRRVARGLYAPILKDNPTLTKSEVVLRAIRQSEKGATVAMLKERTGLEAKQIRNIIFRLNRLGRIRRAGRGVYYFM